MKCYNFLIFIGTGNILLGLILILFGLKLMVADDRDEIRKMNGHMNAFDEERRSLMRQPGDPEIDPTKLEKKYAPDGTEILRWSGRKTYDSSGRYVGQYGMVD